MHGRSYYRGSFVQIMGTSLKNLLVRVILVIFGHFASSDFKVWLR